MGARMVFLLEGGVAECANIVIGALSLVLSILVSLGIFSYGFSEIRVVCWPSWRIDVRTLLNRSLKRVL